MAADELDQVLDACPDLAMAAELARDFAAITLERRGTELSEAVVVPIMVSVCSSMATLSGDLPLVHA
ncbi:hypothetical protein [Kitasatospora sp. NPDC056531]|uniref:hypothetical protein n=1 Tax=Kitasatospora sp. NPDC056531 TaxID=3345856 RepID=UPI0036860F2F